MKIESITIHNFKLFEHLNVSFKHALLQEVSNRFLVLGDNGSGKTTLLQAIALPLALISSKIQRVQDFNWVGFVPARYARWGYPRIEMIVSFEDEELAATHEVIERSKNALHLRNGKALNNTDLATMPHVGNSNLVELVLDEHGCYARGGYAEELQFKGRFYAYQLLDVDPTVYTLLNKLPGIFWFDQHRNLGKLPASLDTYGNGQVQGNEHVSYDAGITQLRRYLNGWKLAELAGSERHAAYLRELEQLYQRIFPACSFAGAELMRDAKNPTGKDVYFLLKHNDSGRTYDLEEMSAGEQAVLPILYEFVQLQVGYAVVLIDEVDLNLHSSAAQWFVSDLGKIGPTCQFIITTHSEMVSAGISQGNICQLTRDSQCL